MIYSMNYLLMERQRSSLYNCYSNIRSFLKETCLMLINKLSEKKGFPHKHLQLLKTLYGMADEMVNKNFMEEKKSNQKKVFVQDNPDDTNVKEGRSANFEELMNSLKEQLNDIDFLDNETSEIVEELDEELADG